MNRSLRPGPSTATSETDVESGGAVVCRNTVEIMSFGGLDCGPFSVDSTFSSNDGRYIFLSRFRSIVALDLANGRFWEFKNEGINLIPGFMPTYANRGIMIYSPLQMVEFVTLRKLYISNVELDMETSTIKLLDPVPFNSDIFIKQMHCGFGKDRFILLSERGTTMEGKPDSIFYVYSTNDITKPIKEIKLSRVNDKILFYHLIDDDIYFFDTLQVGIFDLVFLGKSLIRKTSIRTGVTEIVKTSKFPKCDNYISYGNRPWSITGTWCDRSFYLSLTLPYSDPEEHLFFTLNTVTCEWRRIVVENLPSVRKSIIRPSREEDRYYYLHDDRAGLIISVFDNSKMHILQPRNWKHSELSCFVTNLENTPNSLRVLSKNFVLKKWPEVKNMNGDELMKHNLPGNLMVFQ